MNRCSMLITLDCDYKCNASYVLAQARAHWTLGNEQTAVEMLYVEYSIPQFVAQCILDGRLKVTINGNTVLIKGPVPPRARELWWTMQDEDQQWIREQLAR